MTVEVPTRAMNVVLVYAQRDRAWSKNLILPEGVTAGVALAAARPWLEDAGADLSIGGLAIFGRTATAHSVLRDGDRLEVLRPLSADPKQSRRDRATTPPGAKKR